MHSHVFVFVLVRLDKSIERMCYISIFVFVFVTKLVLVFVLSVTLVCFWVGKETEIEAQLRGLDLPSL